MSRKRATTDGEREVEERLLEVRGGSSWAMKRSKRTLFETELGASIHLTHAYTHFSLTETVRFFPSEGLLGRSPALREAHHCTSGENTVSFPHSFPQTFL